MRKFLFLIASISLFVACGNNKPTHEQKEKAERYIESLVDMGINIYGGELTDANILVLAVDAYPGANFDIYAQTYLEEALSKGLEIEGLNIVDIKDCQIGDGWVIGERIGRAFKE
ncbi:hypothetical protein [Paraprevotella clara]|uniref:hypothetical protein n=1 Tax=Paraprevotella clara TaxID=454154 RepID=UPI003AB4026D